MTPDRTIEFAAPGKAVIWGEYAVLDGAPALVMAVDRYARVKIESGLDHWHIHSTGFDSEADLTRAQLVAIRADSEKGASATLRAALEPFNHQSLPSGADVLTDTRAFHNGPNKLGIGSSAAICTAACAALAELLEQPFSPERALQAHQALQGKTGSGLDVAAACHGGMIRFQNGSAIESQWPAGLTYRFVWVGHSARTTDHVARFNAWRGTDSPVALHKLARASEDLFVKPTLASFQGYVDRLKNLDREADLGIYSEPHQALDKLANSAQVVYKPCGAGGGDIGIAVSDNKSSLSAFDALAAKENFLTLDMEIAANGVHQIRT